MKKIRKVLVWVLGTVVVLILGAQFVLNSKIVDKIVEKYAAPYVDGSLEVSRVRINLLRNFPNVRVTVDGLAITYPHSKFAAYDSTDGHVLLDAGRDAEVDTLASLGHLSAAVNVWKFLRNKEVSTSKIAIDDLRAFAHYYGDAANWDVILLPESEDTTSSPLNLPWIKLRDAAISDPYVVFTDQPDDIYASLAFNKFSVDGAVRAENGDFELRKVKTAIDGLSLLAGYGSCGTRTMLDATAVADLSAKADGRLADGVWPEAEAELKFKEGRAFYAPMSLPLALGLDLAGSITPEGYVKASVEGLKATTQGLLLNVDAEAEDLLGEDPAYRLDADGYAKLDSLLRFVPEELGISRLAGKLNLYLAAAAKQSELNAYRFQSASVRGQIVGDRVFVAMPSDTLDAKLFHPDIRLQSGPEGMDIDADADSIYFNMGANMVARLRGMTNCGTLTKVESHGKMTPRLDLHTTLGRVFFKYGSSRLAASNAAADIAVQKRVRPDRKHWAERRDSLARVHHDLHELRDTALAAHDIRISLDSTLMSYFNQWEPSGNIKLERAMVASPALPLRTRIRGFDANFTGNEVNLDSLRVVCGTSDLAAKGSVKGIRRFLRGRGTLGADLRMLARRINANEILAALQAGTADPTDTVAVASENDESFVVDSLANAEPDSSAIPLIIMPGNIDASISLEAEQIDYTDIVVSPAKSTLKLKDRVLQLTDTDIRTNLGNIGLDAYYSTKSRDDLQAGIDMNLSDVDAYGIIHMLPSVDSLMPLLKSFKGKLGLDLSATTQVDTNMNIVIPTLDGVVKISGEDLFVEDAGDLKKITRLLMFKNKDIGQIQNMYVDAVVHDGKVEVFPFQIEVDRYKLALRGMQSLDKSMYYHASILKSPLPIRFGINLYGTLDNWRFSLGFPKYKDGSVPAYTSQLDTVRVNIAQSIKDVFNRGVKNVSAYNKQNVKKVQAAGGINMYAEPEMMSKSDFAQLDSLAIDMQSEEWEKELYDEVDSILEESYSETAKLMKEYGALMYDESVNKKIERVKKQSAAKSKAAGK